MGPSRHTRAAAAAASSSSRNDESASASALTTTAPSASRTPTRASPYARTPTKPSSSALTVGPSTPTSRTNSPMMLREIFSMISPFRGLSRARRSAAFGGADEVDAQEEQAIQAADRDDGVPSTKLEDVDEAADVEDRMIEDAEEGIAAASAPSFSPAAQRSHLAVPVASRSASRSPSPKSRSSLPTPSRSLPLADGALVTPGLRRQYASAQPDAATATPGPSTSYAPPSQTSPVSRNYDLLARFFSEKQRGGQGGLTEVEVEGCIRLIEESMATGRNLESEFASASSYTRPYPPMQTSGFAPSSRASSIAPSALPSSQSMNNLFHPGTSRMTASSSAYSFLAPRAPASQSGFGAAASSTRRRPIYLGPGMSGLSLSRRRPVVASASRASALAKTQAQGGFMTRSSTDPNLARHSREADSTQDTADRAEDAKRRRTVVATEAGSLAQNASSATDRTAEFEPAYEKQARQSSLLAKDISASSTSTGASGSPLKRAAPAAEPATAASPKMSPPKPTTRTASAIQDILKTTPPVRPPTKPELVNPYQSAAPLAAKSKKAGGDEAASATPVRRSARTSMLTRAKARETAKAVEKNSPPKESVLDLIERTAPKTVSKRKASSEASEPQANGRAAAPEPVSTPPTEPSNEERKLQKTEEVQRRLEALTKAKNQQQQQDAQKPAAAAEKVAKPTASLVPPQYTATKPKKPSPLSAAFQAPDSPSSDSEAAPSQPRGPAIAQPSFSFGSPAASTTKAPSSGFSFSAPKPSTSGPAAAPAPAAAPSGGFSFAKPAAPATSAAPAASPSFSFSPVAAAPAQQKPAAASTANTTTAPSAGFSFSAPAASSSSSSASPRSQVLAEDASKLPKFEWQVPAVSTSSAATANKALRDEIQSVAQAALPKFEFVYKIETPAAEEKEKATAIPAKAAAAPIMGGFSFSAPAATPAPAPAPAAAPAAAETAEGAVDEDASADPSKPQSSGLLGEGEGEESEATLFEVRAKIWRLDRETKAWKDLGICIAKLKHDATTGKHRLLARNEANGKVAVNFRTYKTLQSTLDKTVNSFLGFDGQEPTQYRLKVKTEDMAREFKQKLEEAAAKA